jgi:hypothetical protein
MEIIEEGIYEVTVNAHDPADGNTGFDTTTLVVK